MMAKTKLWTKDFMILAGANFFIAITFNLLMTTLALYAIEQFSSSESRAGLLAGIFIIGALFARLFTGKYLDLIGRKKMLIGSSVLLFVAMVLYIPAHTLSLLFIIRFIHGAAFGSAATTISTAVLTLIPPERRGEGIGYFSLSSTLATAIGPLFGIIILQFFEYDQLFLYCSMFSFMSMLLAFFANIPESSLTEEQLQSMKKGLHWQQFFEKSTIPFALLMVIMGIAYSGIISFIAAYAKEIELTNAASFFFVVYASVLFVSRPLAGKLLDAKGDNIVVYPGIAIFALSLLLLSSVKHGSVLLLAGGLVALGFGTLMSSAQAIIVKKAPKHRLALATSTFFIGLDAGVGIGPTITGKIVELTGFRVMYVCMAAIVAASIIYYYYMHGRKSKVGQEV